MLRPTDKRMTTVEDYESKSGWITISKDKDSSAIKKDLEIARLQANKAKVETELNILRQRELAQKKAKEEEALRKRKQFQKKRKDKHKKIEHQEIVEKITSEINPSYFNYVDILLINIDEKETQVINLHDKEVVQPTLSTRNINRKLLEDKGFKTIISELVNNAEIKKLCSGIKFKDLIFVAGTNSDYLIEEELKIALNI